MGAADVDIYGDLCADFASNLEQATSAPLVSEVLDRLPTHSVDHRPSQVVSLEVLEVEKEESFNFEDGFIAEPDGKCTAGSQAGFSTISDHDRPLDFGALQQELLDDERLPARPAGALVDDGSRAAASPDAASVDDDADTDASSAAGDETGISLDEVRASQMGAAPSRPHFPGARQKSSGEPCASTIEPSAPVSTLAVIGSGAVEKFLCSWGRRRHFPQSVWALPVVSCLSEVSRGGSPRWERSGQRVEMRKQAEMFGPLKTMRFLELPRSGKSAGIVLLEYTSPDGSKRSTDPGDGFTKLPLWDSLSVTPPHLVLVSSELFKLIGSGELPWPDGGPCNEELRAILMRQFDLSHTACSRQVRGGKRADESPMRFCRRRRTDSNTSLMSNSSAARPRSPEESHQGAWADKLKALKGMVNRGQDVVDSSGLDVASRKARKRC